MNKQSNKGFTRKMIWVCAIEVVILVFVLILWMGSDSQEEPQANMQRQAETYAISDTLPPTEPADPIQTTTISETEAPTAAMVEIDMDCDHIFEVFNGKNGIETSCRFCGISEIDLYNAGIELENERCEECEYETVMQTNGTPAYECKKCHNIQIKQSASLPELKLLSDTNAKDKKDDVKYGTFYQDGEKWEDMVRFWVIDKSGYTNTESLEVYLANSYSTLVALAFAGDASDEETNMTLRFYGDGKLIYEMSEITLGAEESYAEIDVTDVEILKVECITEVNAFGYCLLQGIAWY